MRKSPYKTNEKEPLRTGGLNTPDSGIYVTALQALRFDCIKNVACQRTSTLRPTLVNPILNNPTHAAVIADSGIQYDSPMKPEKIANRIQERIESKKTQNPATKQALQGAATFAVSIGRINSIVVSNSLGALSNRKLPNQATSVISGVTSATQTAGGRKMTVQEIQQLRSSSTTVAQFMKHVQAGGGSVTGVSQGGSQRRDVGQQPISTGGAIKRQQQHSQLNMSNWHQAKQHATGETLVAQRTASSATQNSVSASLMVSGSLSSSTERPVTTIATSQGHQQGTPSSATVVTNAVSGPGAPTVEEPMDPQLLTLGDVGNTVTMATTPAPAASSTTRTNTPHYTRTYAARSHKTN